MRSQRGRPRDGRGAVLHVNRWRKREERSKKQGRGEKRGTWSKVKLRRRKER